MVYEYQKDLPRRTASEKILNAKTFKIYAKAFICGLASMVFKFFDHMARATAYVGAGIISGDQQLANELHQLILMKLGAVIPQLKKIQKIFESYETPFEFQRYQHFHQKLAILLYWDVKKNIWT